MPRPPSALSDLSAAGERAADELRGWLEAGERVVALLASPGANRRRTLDALVASLAGRFVAAAWTPHGNSSESREPSALESLRGTRAPPTLLIAEDGEHLGAEGARVLRALAHDPAGAHRAVVAVAAEEAGAVLAGLGPALEVVVLREPRARRAAGSALRAPVALGALALAAGSLALAAAVLLPRLRGARDEGHVSVERRADVAAAPAPRIAALAPVDAPPPPSAVPSASGVPSPSSAAAAPQVAAAPAALGASRPEAADPSPVARAAPPTPPESRVGAPRTGRAQRADARERVPSPLQPPAEPPAREVALGSPLPAAAARGWLVVNAIPRAAIVVDGSAVGETPIVRHPVASGRHRVTARFADGSHDDRVVDVPAGELYMMFDGRGAAPGPPR